MLPTPDEIYRAVQIIIRATDPADRWAEVESNLRRYGIAFRVYDGPDTIVRSTYEGTYDAVSGPYRLIVTDDCDRMELLPRDGTGGPGPRTFRRPLGEIR